MINLESKDLLGTKDLSLEEINLIFETTKKFKEVLSRPIKKVPTLRHLTVANIFF
jgi:aspartate carbamoyltransferase catalytic subunit